MDDPASLQAPAPDKSSELYIRDYPHRSIAIVSGSHALFLRYTSSSSPADAARAASPLSIPYANATRPRSTGAETAATASANSAAATATARCMVEFSPTTDKLLQDYRPLTSRPIYGTLGLIAIGGEVFLSVITQAARAATIRPGETVERIISVDFYCLSSADYDDVVPLESQQQEPDFVESVFGPNASPSPYVQGLGRRDVVVEHPCHELRRLLSNGSFYYSTDFDVTNRVQNRPLNSCSFDIDNFDDTYLWNSFMITPLVQFRSRLMAREREALDASRILTSAVRGFCKTMTLPQSASPLRAAKSRMPSFLTLISRLSCRRAGTRFNARGMDDQGNVANFVETETTFWNPDGILFSYVQVRGSVPVFWEQAADLIPGRQKITITRSRDATQPTFNKHFEDLEQSYGAVHVINLLSESKPAEVELGTMYRTCIGRCPLSRPAEDGSADHVLLRETHYDFHAETKGPGGYEAARQIRQYIESSCDGFVYFLAESSLDQSQPGLSSPAPVLHQEGVFRTNCLDCLDRTNLIQTLVSQMAVEAFLGHRGEFAASDFWMRHSSLWADNGDALSKTYAGTGALKTSFTRHGKMSIAGAMADMRKSMQRIYHNNFVDPSRQITIDMLLGLLVGQSAVHLFDPISDYVSVELARRSQEYTSHKTILIWGGTFNLNGRDDGLGEDLTPWLFPASLGDGQPEIFVVAFQEIVELSPQQIMNSDPRRKAAWEAAVREALNGRQRRLGGESYVPLRSGQLVGAALCIFVRSSSLSHVRNVEGSVKKTGLSGIAGNKGAVAIRLDYAGTHLCFVTAHMAAGFSNYDERNRDYATIHHGLRFQRNRGIEDHDAVIWLGDFNYRIGLSSEAVRELVKTRDLQTLYENDQLNLQMVAGLAFQFYSEARIGFPPTYKFDLGSDSYDTSEKARIPAWTDRVLRRGAILRQTAYDCAPLRFSDHRPVYATFDCRVSLVDKDRKETISKELYARRKAEVGSVTAASSMSNGGREGGESEGATETETETDEDDEDLIGYDAIEPGLPPASSDRQKWWLEGRQPARVQIPIPRGRDGRPMGLNPQRGSNPFGQGQGPGEESDWISVAKSSPGASLSSISSSPYEKIAPPRGMMGFNGHSGHGGPRKPSSSTPSSTPTPTMTPAPMLLHDSPVRMKMKMGLGAPAGSQAGSEEAVQEQQHVPPVPPPPRRSNAKSNLNLGQNLNLNPKHSESGHDLHPQRQTQRQMQTQTQQPLPARTQPPSPPARVQAQTQAPTQAQVQVPVQAQAVAAPPAAAPSQLSQQIKASRSAPPIARKPVHLQQHLQQQSQSQSQSQSAATTSLSSRASGATPPPHADEQQQQQQGPPVLATGTGLLVGTVTGTGTGRKPVAPPKPATLHDTSRNDAKDKDKDSSRSDTNISGKGKGKGGPDGDGDGDGEGRPWRRGRRREGPVDLLDALEGSGEEQELEEMGGWETLQPSAAR